MTDSLAAHALRLCDRAAGRVTSVPVENFRKIASGLLHYDGPETPEIEKLRQSLGLAVTRLEIEHGALDIE